MKNNRVKAQKRGPIRYITLLTALFMSGFLLFQIWRSYTLTFQKLEILDQAKEEVEQLRLRNVELVLMSEKVVTEAYIESQARDRLNYAKDGELLYIIPEELLEDPDLNDYLVSLQYGYQPVDTKPPDVLTEWLELFQFGI